MLITHNPFKLWKLLSCILLTISAVYATCAFASARDGEKAQNQTALHKPKTTHQNDLRLTAGLRFKGAKTLIKDQIYWVVYRQPKGTQNIERMKTLQAQRATFELPPGSYIVTGVYGFALAAQRVTLTDHPVDRILDLDAGQLKVHVTNVGQTIQKEALSVSMYIPVKSDYVGTLIKSDLDTEHFLVLQSGIYHLVSHYGKANSIESADARVESGQVTELKINHRAGEVVFTLREKESSEPIAGATFSVITPSGDSVIEMSGAIPKTILNQGEYMVVARYKQKAYTRSFEVEAGHPTTVTVLMTENNDVIPNEPPKDSLPSDDDDSYDRD